MRASPQRQQKKAVPNGIQRSASAPRTLPPGRQEPVEGSPARAAEPAANPTPSPPLARARSEAIINRGAAKPSSELAKLPDEGSQQASQSPQKRAAPAKQASPKQTPQKQPPPKQAATPQPGPSKQAPPKQVSPKPLSKVPTVGDEEDILDEVHLDVQGEGSSSGSKGSRDSQEPAASTKVETPCVVDADRRIFKADPDMSPTKESFREPSEGYDEEMEESACKIQCMYRRRQARREVEARRAGRQPQDVPEDEEDPGYEDPADEGGSEADGGADDAGEGDEEEESARKIQCMYRRRQARREVEARRAARRAAGEPEDQEGDEPEELPPESAQKKPRFQDAGAAQRSPSKLKPKGKQQAAGGLSAPGATGGEPLKKGLAALAGAESPGPAKAKAGGGLAALLGGGGAKAGPGGFMAAANAMKRANAVKNLGVRAGGSKKTKCVRTVAFDSAVQAIRTAVAVKDEVWIADMAGSIVVRERESPEQKPKAEFKTAGVVWALCLVPAPVPQVWVGQERNGILVYNAATRELMCTLTGGHHGNVVALASAPGPGGRMDVFSASNDFSVRCWHVEEGNGKSSITFKLPNTKPQLQVRRGQALYGHSNGVRCLLRVGPNLWSGSSDQSIRIWRTATGECAETVANAHDGTVLQLVTAGEGIWSSGYDGRVREWSLSGLTRTRLREISFNEPLRAMRTVGDNVWMCQGGRSSDIQVVNSEMKAVDTLAGHTHSVVSLSLVEESEVSTIWSSAPNDVNLRIWSQTSKITGMASRAELIATAKSYEEEGWTHAQVLAAMQQEKADLQSESRDAIAKARAELEEQEALTKKEQQEHKESEDQRGKEEKRANAAEAKAAKLQKELAAMQKKLDATETERDSWQERAKKHEAAATVLAAGAEVLRAEKSEAQDDLSELKKLLKQEQLKIRAQADEIHRLKSAAQEAAETAAGEIHHLNEQRDLVQVERESVGTLLRAEKQAKAELERELSLLKRKDAKLEKEYEEVCKREEELRLKYAQLDVFKLDVIARELKGIDTEISALRNESRSFLQISNRMLDPADRREGNLCAQTFIDMASKMRGRVRDVIKMCLSETQKLNSGLGVRTYDAAGVLKDGGVMAGYVVAAPPSLGEEPVKMHPRQRDEILASRRDQPSPSQRGSPSNRGSPPPPSQRHSSPSPSQR